MHTLLAVGVLDHKGSGTVSSVIRGIDWVTGRNTDKYCDGSLNKANDIKVANMSLGGWNDGLRDDGNCGKTIKDLYH